ncbi:MAG: hypothetical protein GX418_11830 [Clostridiales bacterium]|nr:hypothetical protein [Clostridiales bacterium]
MRTHRKERTLVLGFLAVWFVLNLIFLTRFPLVHSDEAWLSGLTRNMLASGSPAVTEPFFDLKPRYPHAIKILFHLLQMPFLLIFGDTVFAVRLPSLLAGVAALYLVFRCARAVASFWLSLGVAVLVSVCGPFIDASHTARQEILLFVMQLMLLLPLLQSGGRVTGRLCARLGLLAGLSAGLHPNAFLLALGGGGALVLMMLVRRRFRLRPLLGYIAVTGGVALVFVGLSFLFDPQFPAHYVRYGQTEFDLVVPVADKFQAFVGYLGRLWRGESGTYVLPDLRPLMALAALLIPSGIARAFRKRDAAPAVIAGLALGALLGTILIGRYNQLSAALWLLPCLLLVAPLLSGKRLAAIALPAVTAVFALAAVPGIRTAAAYPYETYLSQIARYASPEDKALANLNAGFFFENGRLLDVRNLSYLKENGLTFQQYVQSRGIEVILWSGEMDYLYRRRPDFNTVYGNLRYVEEAEAFFAERCTLVGSFENPGYAVRLAQEIGKPYRVDVYRVNPSAGSGVAP